MSERNVVTPLLYCGVSTAESPCGAASTVLLFHTMSSSMVGGYSCWVSWGLVYSQCWMKGHTGNPPFPLSWNVKGTCCLCSPTIVWSGSCRSDCTESFKQTGALGKNCYIIASKTCSNQALNRLSLEMSRRLYVMKNCNLR